MTLADTPPADNAPAYSVCELSFALKRTLEEAYGFVRLRGEVSKVTRHASGHVYLSLKDERACIDGVIWKGQVRGLQCQPEQGLEVIAVPHNGNVSNGLMFNTKDLSGKPLTREYAERRMANEPLAEIIQAKGQSDTDPALSPNDEFANFEIWKYLLDGRGIAQFLWKPDFRSVDHSIVQGQVAFAGLQFGLPQIVSGGILCVVLLPVHQRQGGAAHMRGDDEHSGRDPAHQTGAWRLDQIRGEDHGRGP